jgi:hypothetical protein
MSKRFSNQLISDFHERNNNMSVRSIKNTNNLYIKRYPNFFKREDVHGDFISVQRELRSFVPAARVVKEDVDANFVRIQFDVAPSDEVLLEKLLLKRGFIKGEKSL